MWVNLLNGNVKENEIPGQWYAPLAGRAEWMGENVRCRVAQSKQQARPGCGHYVRWSYQALPPAEPRHSIPLLPLPGAPKTWAFISRAKYPRSLQSLSFLALRQSDNYLFSFPLLLASREVFWLELVCMKYYQSIAHFSIPAASDIRNMESWQLWLTGVCLSCSSENNCFVLELQ